MFHKQRLLVPAVVAVCFTMLSSGWLASVAANAIANPHGGKAAVEKQTGKPLFIWKVTDGTNKLYLLGSIHLVRPDFYPLPAEMEKAFQNSDVLVLEVDETKSAPGAMEKMMVSQGMYSGGDTLTNHISKKSEKYLTEYLNTHAGTNLLSMRPWLAGMMIPLLEMRRLGFDPEQGIDRHFLNEAVSTGKATDEVESAEFQMKLISGLSDELQDKLLLASLLEIADIDKDLAEMVKSWKSGSAEEVAEVVTKDERQHPELKEFSEKLLYERNPGMASKIEGYLKTGKTHFVVVGSAHLVGDRGLIKILKDRHYTVEQLKSGDKI